MQRNFTMLLLAASAALAFGTANANADMHGQWIGNSQLEGSRSVAKTTLVLDADDSTLHIEDRNTCTLKHGSYSADAGDTLSLSFKEAKGGEACERLAKGRFTVTPGSGPRSLRFEVTYPGPDGSENIRRGALSRYP